MVLLLSVLLLIYGFYMGGLQYVIADISATFVADANRQGTGIGILVSVPHIFSLFFPVLMGAISDKVGKKKVLLSFIVVFSVGSAITGGAGNMVLYLVGVTMVGIGHSVCESVSTAVLSDLDPAKSAQNINLSQGFLSAGAMAGPVLMQWLINATDATWRYLFFISGACFMAMFVLLTVTAFPASQPAAKERNEGHKIPLFGSVVLLACMASMMLYIGTEKGIGNFTESYFSKELLREDLGALAITMYWGGMTVSRFVLRLKQAKLRRTLMLHFAIVATLFVVLRISSFAYLSLAVCFFIGFAAAPLWSGLVAYAAQQHPEHSGAVAGMMSSSGSVGSTIAPFVMGVVSDSFGYGNGFLLMSVFAWCATLLLLFAKKRK